MQSAIFLDRDGVIIENCPDYVRSWEDVKIFPQALEALARLSHSPYKIVIVTNQAGIGKGLIPMDVAQDINQRLVDEIENAGGRVDGIFLCPHAPEDGCDCRKPRPGLLLQAARVLCLDISQSYMIGDALTDLQAGQAAGVRKTVLVRTGRGEEQAHFPGSTRLLPFLVYDTLAAALADLVG